MTSDKRKEKRYDKRHTKEMVKCLSIWATIPIAEQDEVETLIHEVIR